MTLPVLATDRLLLRPWRAADLAPFAALCADPEVMRHFPGALARNAAAAVVARLQDRWREDGFGFGVIERHADGAFLGMAGLSRLAPTFPLAGAVEIGWRLARAHWGAGYATEAARAWAAFGFETLQLPEIVAFTVAQNRASQAVALRLGMRRDPARDFDHPALPEGHRLGRHLVFALAAP